jgi:general secretion pathway protein D
MSPRLLAASLLGCTVLLLSGCPKGGQEYSAGRQAELAQDWDTAVVSYERALKADPLNAEYKLKIAKARFESGQAHIRQGQKLREKGQIEVALAEFQKALAIDPSSSLAEQEVRSTLELLAAKNAANTPPSSGPAAEEPKLMEKPPELRPISSTAINLKMSGDVKVVFQAICKLANIGVIFDPDIQGRNVSVELPNVTLEQALDVVSLQSKTFWKPVTSSIIIVVPEQSQKRKDYDELVLRTFYLSNTIQAQDLTEIVTGLRQILDLHRVTQVNSLNAIMVRDTPDKIAAAEKMIRDIDKAKPEVDVEVAVMEIRRDRLQNLGISPGTSVALTFTPGGNTSSSSSTTGSTTTTSATGLTLRQLGHLSGNDYSVTLPGATATALYTDSTTKIIQDPQIRMLDGQPGKLRIGDKVPVATGSFQAGVGVGVAGTGGAGIVNPLVNTQFTYYDVGVNLDITPHIHPDGEITLKIMVEVSSVSGTSAIGGINQPIISQRHAEQDVRLKEGEANVLAGLIDRTQTKNLNGWPGVSKIPLLRYLFSQDNTEIQEQEILIVMTPRLVRRPTITAENMKSMASGSDTFFQVRREGETQAPPAPPQPQAPSPAPSPAVQPPPQGNQATQQARLRFDPPTVSLKPGDETIINVAVDNVQDLFSIPMLLQYNPAIISIEEVSHGGFLSGGTQEIALVQRVDKDRGQAIISATRQPNTPGVNGSGTLLGIKIKAVGPGSSTISVLQVNARDSQQKPIQLITSEAAVRVQ